MRKNKPGIAVVGKECMPIQLNFRCHENSQFKDLRTITFRQQTGQFHSFDLRCERASLHSPFTNRLGVNSKVQFLFLPSVISPSLFSRTIAESQRSTLNSVSASDRTSFRKVIAYFSINQLHEGLILLLTSYKRSRGSIAEVEDPIITYGRLCFR